MTRNLSNLRFWASPLRRIKSDQVTIDLHAFCRISEDGTPDETTMEDCDRVLIEDTRALIGELDQAAAG